jgi:hypothetical protein
MKLFFSSQGKRACRAEGKRRRAFSLLEVMIAIGIFFLAVFAILSLVSSSLANARRLQRPQADGSSEMAIWAATNILIEGIYQGSLGDSDHLGKAYRDYNYTTEIIETGSNHLYTVRTIIQLNNGNREIISDLTQLRFAPQSPPGSMEGGNFIRR